MTVSRDVNNVVNIIDLSYFPFHRIADLSFLIVCQRGAQHFIALLMCYAWDYRLPYLMGSKFDVLTVEQRNDLKEY